MKERRHLALVLIVAAACTGPHPAPAASGPPHSSPSPTALSSPVQMDELVLTADFSEPAAQWQRVVFLPFGSHREQLGLKQFPESPSSLPSAFAIDVDGSIWIADRWKSRLAHFSAAGAYLGEIPLGPGIRTEDLAMQGPDLLVITRVANGQLIVAQIGQEAKSLTLNDHGRAVVAVALAPSASGLTAETGGFSDALFGGTPSGPMGFAAVDLTTGQIRTLPGLPLRSDEYFSLREPALSGEQDVDLEFVGTNTVSVQPVHVDIRVGDQGRSRSIKGLAGFGELVRLDGDVCAFVRIAGVESPNHQVAGTWLARFGRSPVVWERLPDRGIADELQKRHIAAGPDGTLYLMLAQKGGMEILRRP